MADQAELSDGSVLKSATTSTTTSNTVIPDDNTSTIIDNITRLLDSEEDVAPKQEWKFWRTQPVTPLGVEVPMGNNGPIEENKQIEQLKQEPYQLPEGLLWGEINVLDDEQLKELYTFLYENYVEDDDNMFRFDYSMPFLRWALCSPGWDPKWHVTVRQTENGEIIGFYSAAPIRMKVYDKEVPMVETNFLCVHKKFRLKRITPALIAELYRRVNLNGIFQGVNTAGVLLPGVVGKCLYWHRSINVEKLLAVRFTHLGRNMTVQRMKKLYQLPNATQVTGFREMHASDIPKVFALLAQYLKQFDLSPLFTEEEFQYLCQNRPNIVSSFVVEQEDGEITDFASYYHLSSTVLNHPQYKTLNICYMYYYAATRTPLCDLVNDCLIQAQKSGCDVFNAIDAMDSKEYLEKLRFGPGDGYLHYYIYNWQCPKISPEKIALVLL